MVDYPEDQVLHEGTDIRYYVSHTPQNKPVIIKDFSCANMQDVAAHIREGIVQAEIAHPNICKMITMQPEQDGPRFRVKIVFEFIQKRLLKEIEERRGHNPPLHYTEDELRVFLRKIANALRLAHSKNIAHRDINPEHIYITPEGEYKLSDFGSAWRKDDERAYASTLVGQFMFMCPAMKCAAAAGQRNVEGGYNEQKADVYSLGVTLIFMAKLYPPNSLSSMAKYDLNLEKLLGEVIATGISPQFAHIIRNMVRAEESQCYDITNVIEALSQPTPTTVAFALTSRHLHYYSFPEHGWRTVALSGAALQIDNKSYVVNIEGVTRPEADMRTGRLRPGIVYHYDSISVFVFGGSEDGGAPIKTAIKYSFAKPDNFLARRRPSGAWEQLSDMMHPRSHFNPCLFAGLIYIAGGGHPSIEAYDPPSGQTRGLIRSDEIDPDISLMVSHMDKLVLIGNARVFRRSYSNPRIEEKRDRIAGNALWSNMTPVVVEDAAYIVVMTGETITLLKLGVYTARVLVEKRYGEEVGNS